MRFIKWTFLLVLSLVSVTAGRTTSRYTPRWSDTCEVQRAKPGGKRVCWSVDPTDPQYRGVRFVGVETEEAIVVIPLGSEFPPADPNCY